MEFNKFCEICNSNRIKKVDLIRDLGLRCKWQITEKIHGSNLGIFIKKDSGVYYATRNTILPKEKSHYHHLHVLNDIIKFDPKKVLGTVINISGDDFDEIAIFGEIFGGSYPADGVDKVNNATRVQKGIYYCPDNGFMAFDILMCKYRTQEEKDSISNEIKVYKNLLSDILDNIEETGNVKNFPRRANDTYLSNAEYRDILDKNSDMVNEANKLRAVISNLQAALERANGKYLDVEITKAILDLAGIPRVPELAIVDTLDDALNFSPVFESEVYKYYNLPKIENNYAEGVVIRPLINTTLNNGSRVILKHKNEKFEEVIKIKDVANIIKSPQEEVELVYTTKKLMDAANNYININRLDAVVSKMERPLTSKDFGKILRNINIDAIEDMKKDFEEDIKEVVEVGEFHYLTKYIYGLSAKLLKANMAEIVG